MSRPACRTFFVDRLRLKQILPNLLSNAIKFTPAGGSVRIEARTDGEGRMLFSVIDSGIGMAKESIPLALEPFRQIASPLCAQCRRHRAGRHPAQVADGNA